MNNERGPCEGRSRDFPPGNTDPHGAFRWPLDHSEYAYHQEPRRSKDRYPCPPSVSCRFWPYGACTGHRPNGQPFFLSRSLHRSDSKRGIRPRGPGSWMVDSRSSRRFPFSTGFFLGWNHSRILRGRAVEIGPTAGFLDLLIGGFQEHRIGAFKSGLGFSSA